jgi:hypothetical protein
MRLDGFTPHIAADADARPVVATFGEEGPLSVVPRPRDDYMLGIPREFPSLGWFGFELGAFDDIDAAREAEPAVTEGLEPVVGSAQISDDGIYASLDFRSTATDEITTHRFKRVPLMGGE